MNTTQTQGRKEELTRKLVKLVKKGDIPTFKFALEQHEEKMISKYNNMTNESKLIEYFAKKTNRSDFRHTLMLYENIVSIQVSEKEIAAFKAKRRNDTPRLD